jgi:hypothetical protein
VRTFVDSETLDCRVKLGLSRCDPAPEKPRRLFEQAVKLATAAAILNASGAAGEVAPAQIRRKVVQLNRDAKRLFRRGALAARASARRGDISPECRDALVDAARDAIGQVLDLMKAQRR